MYECGSGRIASSHDGTRTYKKVEKSMNFSGNIAKKIVREKIAKAKYCRGPEANLI